MPALATKDFALRFLAFKEGVTAATVTFTNDDTEEYIFHHLRVTTTQPGVQASRSNYSVSPRRFFFRGMGMLYM